ncbi:hypothetical protein LPJ60_003770 [Coemansia sp. RSA 2675]|uniref:Uncharacterized protein n=2 Tax=Coemansia TaxID=4863 RepID=A0A9W8L675_9FUNG|nr:hypothetical protein LPJ60_003770 [Coemansia sp. RSA 2675]KAJ2025747.1 hypothetical protein GGI06_000454 [Coemansia sp. S85]KAJ2416630.1 hypothetical protein GGI10_000815 [Coemansia sp. RSA 2530]KAJ2690536.1 hypothetical protein IWW39_000630 [Coemansia spiralis]KAJ2696098.1 hypothetical protein H4218_004821 [Coemansia sp. IMI 209128]KAJ2792088.1 hypothetical protein GGI18_000665 [Coemansia linderi]
MATQLKGRTESMASQEKAVGGVYDNSYDEFGPGATKEGGNIIEAPADMIRAVPGKLSVWTLLVVVMELCERFAYYGASLMFSIYLQKILHQSKPQAVALNRVNQFMSYATTILGAVIADQWLGKFKTILIFASLYLVGLVLLTISSADFSIEGGFGLAGFCISVFAFIGFGTGGIKSNVSSFMAEQIPLGFKPTKTPGVYEDSKLTIERGFRYFYWSINLGAFIGQLICPQVAKNKSYAMAFMIPAIVFFVGIVVFVAGSKNYIKKKPQGTVLTKVWRCMKYARKNKKEGQAHWLNGALGAENVEWNDEFVIGLQRSLRACKVFLFYPLYWALYNNMSDNFINQGLTMKRPSWLSVDQLNVVNSLVLVISIPIFDNFVFPLLRRCGLRMGPIARITTGFVIVVCGFIYVTVLQKVIYTKGPYYDFTGPNIPVGATNDISVWFQIVPYAAVAISEIFASVTGLEFAFSQAPAELKSVLTAVFLFTNCGGALIGLILAIWGGDPQVLYVFAAETAVLGVMTIVFYFCFRHYDVALAEQEQFDS